MCSIALWVIPFIVDTYHYILFLDSFVDFRVLAISVSTRSINVYTWSRSLRTLTRKPSSPPFFMFICSYMCLFMLILFLLFATCLSFLGFMYHVFVSSAFCTMYSSRYLQYFPEFSGLQVTHRVSKSEWFFLQKILYEDLRKCIILEPSWTMHHKNGFSYGKYCMKPHVNVTFLYHALQPTSEQS